MGKELTMPLSQHHAKDKISNEEEDEATEVSMANMNAPNDFKAFSCEDVWIDDT